MTSIHRRQAINKLGGAVAASTVAGFLSCASAKDGSAKSKIKIGQIGVGHGHANKLSVYRASSDYEVVGVVERDETLRKRVEASEPFRNVPWMTQEQLLNVPGLQAVLVESRVSDLLSLAEACVDAGKHVHLDKPAGVSLPHYKRILDKAAEKKLFIQMGYMYRYNPAIQLLKDFIRKGWLGDIFEVHTVMSKVVDPASRRELAEFSGGIMLELGCHIIDLVITVLGKPTSVTPYSQNVATSGDNLTDNRLSVLEFPRAIATVKSSAVEVDGFERRHFVVCGTKGTFHIQPLDNPSARVTLDQPRAGYQKGYQELTFPKFARYIADAADMASVLRGEKGSDYSSEHDFLVQSTVLQSCGMPLT
jgi:predicted dehydrogenase